VPELMLFCGYTLILTIDKVFFDTHGLLAKNDENNNKLADPADDRFFNEVLDLIAQ